MQKLLRKDFSFMRFMEVFSTSFDINRRMENPKHGSCDAASPVSSIPHALLTVGLTAVFFLGLTLSLNAQTVTVQNTTSVASTGTNVNSLSVSHTVASSTNRLLLAGISLRRNKADAQVSSVTYGGSAMTLVGTTTTGEDRIAIYRMVNPPVGVANVVASFNTTVDDGAVIGAVSFSGVNQTTPLGTYSGTTGSNAAPTITIASATGELVFGAATFHDTAPATSNAGQTQQYNRFSDIHIGGSGGTKAGASSVSMSWSTNGSNTWAVGAVSIKPNPAPVLSTSVTNASCSTSSNGAITLSVTGGVAPYMYSWSNGATTQNISGLAPGTYTVTVTDNVGSTSMASATVSSSTSGAIITGAISPVSTAGGTDGAINVSLTGGTAPITYSWNNGATSQDLYNISAGIYSITVSEGNGCVGTRSFTVAENRVYKQLYLSDPSQALDRIDPVGTADGTTASTSVLATTTTVTTTITTTKATYNYQEGSSSTRNFGSDGVLFFAPENGFLGRAFIEFDLSSIPAGATITSAQLRVVHTNNADCAGFVGGGNPFSADIRRVTRSWVEGTVCNTGQTGSLTWASAGTTNWTTAGGDFVSTVYGSFTGGNADADGTVYLTNITSLVNEWYTGTSPNFGLGLVPPVISGGNWYNLYSDEAANAANRPQLIVTYTVPSTPTVTFTQSPSLCSPLTVKAGNPITVTNYVTVTSGSMPSNPNVTAILKYGTTTFATLTNPVYNAGAGTLSWSTTLGSDVTIPAGQAIALEVTSAQSGVGFTIDYDSQTDPSFIGLPVSTYINTTALAMYNAPYPGGSIITTAPNGSTVYLRGVVSDPFGNADITGMDVAIIAPGGGTTNVTATSVATAGCTRTYEYAWTIPTTGSYTFRAKAKEGFENTVMDVREITFNDCPASITATVTKTNVTCFGTNTGSITVSSPTGSVGPYETSINGTTWFPVSTGSPYTFTNLGVNTYTVQIRDIASPSCLFSLGTQTITQPAAALSGTLASQTNVLCFGDNTGTATVIAAGGTAPYQYRIGTGSYGSSNIFTGLAVGTYTITIRDANNCTVTVNVTITQPANAISSTAVVIQPQCFSFGSITLTVTGGTAPYTYNWADVPGTSDPKDRSGLAGGSYSVIITDANGCTSTSNITLTSPTNCAAVTVCQSSTNAIFSVPPDPTNASYTWTVPAGAVIVSGQGTPQISVNMTGVAQGAYQICVVANNLCGTTAQTCQDINVTVPVASLTANSVCTGSTIQLFATGGVTYAITGPNGFVSSIPNPTILNATAVNAGVYNVTVTDANGCTATASRNVTVNQGPTATAVITNGTCSNNAGAVDITVSAGTAPYTFLWSNGATTQNISGLVTGYYTLVITDANGCKANVGANVTSTNGAVITATSTNILCAGSATGSITTTVTGSPSPYTFLWSNGATTQNISGLTAGTYVLTATLSNGCKNQLAVTITEPIPLQTNFVKTNVNCFGQSTGAINIIPSGGVEPYTYTWTKNGVGIGNTTANITALGAGTYVATVKDANNCTTTQTVTITQPSAALAATADITNVSCAGGTNGQIVLVITGGTAPYTYAWTGPSFSATTKDISGRGAGTYSVIITDASGCTTTLSNLVITSPPALTISTPSITTVSCFGGSNGVISITVSGGTAPYTYTWSTGATTNTVTGLVVGSYTVTVTDSKGCQATSSAITVTGPSQALTATTTPTNPSCAGASTGSITLNPVGGTAPYTFAWSNGSTVQSPTGLAKGIYSVIVTDAKGCQTVASATLTDPPVISVSGAITNVVCNGGSTGAITLTTSGGVGTLTYLWNNGATTKDRTGLAAGTYTVTVRDANNCTTVKSYTVTQNSLITVSTGVTNISCFGSSNGSISLTVSGGTAPYTYSWSNGATTKDISGLGVGSYTVTVTDANNCTLVRSVSITQPSPITATANAVKSVSCKGGSDGSATVTVSGGTAPYTYLWSNGSTVQTPTNLTAGTHTVNVTDARGCLTQVGVIISEPFNSMSLFSDVINGSACGGNTSSINTTIQDGTAPYTFTWTGPTPIGNVQNPTNLSTGNYTVNVTDALGCTSSLNVTVGTAPALIVSVATENPSCNVQNGIAIASVTGGTAPYTFAWSPGGATTETLTSLAAGTYTVTVTDANGCTATASGVLAAPTNCLPPIAVNDFYTVNPGVLLNGTVAPNDSDPDGINSELKFFPLSVPAETQGTLTWIGDNGTFTFTSAPGFYGTVLTPYRTCDPTGLCADAVLSITVPAPPIAVNDIAVTPQNKPVVGNVLTNDSDPQNSPLTVTATPISLPTKGTVSALQPNGTYTYTPFPNSIGEDVFCYSITNGFGLKDTACVTIDIIPTSTLSNEPPIAVDDNTETPKNTPVVIVVKANDSDPEGLPLGTPIKLTNPTNGTAVINPDGTATYTPNTNFVGTDSFTYSVCEVGSPTLCDDATVTIIVKPTPPAGNQPPVAVDDATLTSMNTPVSNTVVNNDSDPDNTLAQLTFTKLTDPANGTVTFSSNGSYTYTPNNGFIGNDSFTYRVCDPNNACDAATVSIAILNPTQVALLPKVWLQGALFGVSGASGIMRDDLRSKNLIPLTSPYPGMGMTEITPSSAITSAVLGVASPVQNSIVDWVFVELRDAANPTTVLNSTSALIQRDGDIVGLDGVSPVIFNQANAGNYYVAVKHRNHLGVMSASPIAMSLVPATVDFRNGSTPAYNLNVSNITNVPQVVVDQGLALWAGNSLVDTRVIFQGNSNDVNVLFQSVIGHVGNLLGSPFYKIRAYHIGDINMNGETVFQGSGNDVEFIYLNVIQNHPGNILKQNFFIIRQQLP